MRLAEDDRSDDSDGSQPCIHHDITFSTRHNPSDLKGAAYIWCLIVTYLRHLVSSPYQAF